MDVCEIEESEELVLGFGFVKGEMGRTKDKPTFLPGLKCGHKTEFQE